MKFDELSTVIKEYLDKPFVAPIYHAILFQPGEADFENWNNYLAEDGVGNLRLSIDQGEPDQLSAVVKFGNMDLRMIHAGTSRSGSESNPITADRDYVGKKIQIIVLYNNIAHEGGGGLPGGMESTLFTGIITDAPTFKENEPARFRLASWDSAMKDILLSGDHMNYTMVGSTRVYNTEPDWMSKYVEGELFLTLVKPAAAIFAFTNVTGGLGLQIGDYEISITGSSPDFDGELRLPDGTIIEGSVASGFLYSADNDCIEVPSSCFGGTWANGDTVTWTCSANSYEDEDPIKYLQRLLEASGFTVDAAEFDKWSRIFTHTYGLHISFYKETTLLAAVTDILNHIQGHLIPLPDETFTLRMQHPSVFYEHYLQPNDITDVEPKRLKKYVRVVVHYHPTEVDGEERFRTVSYGEKDGETLNIYCRGFWSGDTVKVDNIAYMNNKLWKDGVSLYRFKVNYNKGHLLMPGDALFLNSVLPALSDRGVLIHGVKPNFKQKYAEIEAIDYDLAGTYLQTETEYSPMSASINIF